MRAENMSFKIEIEMMKLQLHGKVGESAANAISNYITAKAELAQQKGEYLKLQRASKTLEKEVLAVAEERDEAHRELAKLRQRDPRGMEALQKQLEDERDGRAAAEEQIRQLEDELDYAEQNRPGDQSLENLAVSAAFFALSLHAVC
jgi:chromosome segregation ATPase